jgi:hypothetical protein
MRQQYLPSEAQRSQAMHQNIARNVAAVEPAMKRTTATTWPTHGSKCCFKVYCTNTRNYQILAACGSEQNQLTAHKMNNIQMASCQLQVSTSHQPYNIWYNLFSLVVQHLHQFQPNWLHSYHTVYA